MAAMWRLPGALPPALSTRLPRASWECLPRSASSWRRASTQQCRIYPPFSAERTGSTASPEGQRLDLSIAAGKLRLILQRYQVADQTFRMVAPEDVDAILDNMIAEGNNDGDPYWARCWPSAIALAHQVLSRPELVRGRRVADLGCGLGITGLAAALAGASEVVLLDREPLALQCAMLSAYASGLTGGRVKDVEMASSGTAAAPQSAAAARPLAGQQLPPPSAPALVTCDLEGKPVAAQALHAALAPQQPPSAPVGAGSSPATLPGNVRAVVYDWNTTQLQEKFDVVLACDVLYEMPFAVAVSDAVAQLLSPRDGSMLLLGDVPDRTPKVRAAFLEAFQSRAASSRGLRIVLEESSRQQCAVNKLDNEMLGGVSSEVIPIQFMVFANQQHSTVGIKRLG